MISRLPARALGSPITLWCSAAVGILAASGRLLAVLCALGVLTIHLVLRPAGRLIDRAPQSDTDTVNHAVVRIRCDRREEPHLRALLIQLLSSTDPRLTGVRVRCGPDDTTTLEASVTFDGAPGAELEHLVARLSLEPGVHDLHRHLAEQNEDLPAEKVPA